MSLKFFFNRKGGVVTSLTIIGWLAASWHLYHLPAEWASRGALTGTLYLAFLSLCFFITLTRLIPWYASKDRGAGIEEHFEKTLVPTSYIMVITNLLYFLWKSCWPFLLFTLPLLLLIIGVNLILLYFHSRDKDPTPPSYFARSIYKIEKING